MMSNTRIDEETLKSVAADIAQLTGTNARDPSWLLRRHEIEQIATHLPKGGTLLDVGSGFGFVPRYFHQLGYKVISVDYPAAGGLDALKSLMDLGIEGHYTQVGFEPLPLSDESVDVVFGGNVIEHLPNSPRIFLNDLKRVSKSGGHLIVDTKNAVDLKTRMKVLMGISNWAPLSTYYDLDIHPHHHKEYTLAELKDALCRVGLHDVQGAAFECFFHLSLKKFKGVQAMGKKREDASQFGTGFNPLHPYEYIRIVLRGLTNLVPGLRSDILAVGRK